MKKRKISSKLLDEIDAYIDNAVVCKCGAINNYQVEVKSNNHVATCNICGSFIKNIPHDKPRFFQKPYYGIAIDDVDDIGYLKWALRTCTHLKDRQKQAIVERIQQLEFLMK